MSGSVHFDWRDPNLSRSFRAAACLHGHTTYSEECLWFLPRYLAYVPGASAVLKYEERDHRPKVDFSRAYWTPPLSPISALRVEEDQIAKLGLRPFVSLTDHDNIDAGTSLRMTTAGRETPVSVEWTVPYHRSIFHLGIHNLPPLSARAWMRTMADYTATPDERLLPEILTELARIPDVLIVLNHPFWLEEQVIESEHRSALDRLLRECHDWIHAFELNGTRRWKENAAVVELASAYSRPVISGGDRHACEPAACLNLTNSDSFSEFVAEVKAGHGLVLFMPHYRESMTLRITEACWEILRHYPEYPGRERWTDRFFYRTDDGVAQPLSTLWKDRAPWVVRPVTAILPFLGNPTVRQTLRFLFSLRAESL